MQLIKVASRLTEQQSRGFSCAQTGKQMFQLPTAPSAITAAVQHLCALSLSPVLSSTLAST